MKNVKLVFWVLISIVVISPIYTFAESITNYNGIVISEEELDNFLKLHPYEYIMYLDEEEYAKLKGLDYNNIESETKYIESTYNPHLGITSEREITEEEFNEPMPLLDSGGASTGTTAKKITITLAGGEYWNYVTLTATWKGIPETRSFDVIGFRGQNLKFRNGSQKGKQMYTLSDGTSEMIDYAWNGTHINRFDNGFGFSMNIVNSNITSLILMALCDVTPTANTSTIIGSYQHATKSLSLNDSLNYTLGGGLGGVFVFPYSISQKYDGMQGIELYY